VVFFDEFDSALAEMPLGWLQWLLAPMQDGVVVEHGNVIELKKALFVFAGGTADTFEEFPSMHEAYFRRAKGPDFLSRLRGHLNVLGPNNGPYCRVRRAIILRRAIERVAPGLLDGKQIPTARMADAFIDCVLAVGRYRHGARSVEALVEMSTKPDQTEFSTDHLPSEKVLANHVDNGPLADRLMALSAGGSAGTDYKAELDAVWSTVAIRLLEFGAGLIYGGAPHGFTKSLGAAAGRLPRPLRDDEKKSDDYRVPPRAVRATLAQASTGPKQPSEDTVWIDVKRVPGLCPEEFVALDLPHDTDLRAFGHQGKPTAGWRTNRDCRKQLGNALAMFRMRAVVTRFAVAHIVFGGKEQGSSGRFPGIAEEVMLSLAHGRPLYICGWFGGAAQRVGQVLGLGEPWPSVPACLQRETHGPWAELLETAVQEWGSRFQLPHRRDLPLSYASLVDFLREHALGGPGWPDNGLTASENHTLFRCADAEEIVRLVTKGLRRCS
jgi:hypothetical protein